MISRSFFLSNRISASKTAKLRLTSKAGFSLIEVAISIAIIIFALVPMMGLLAGGLATVHSTVNNSLGAEITQEVKTSLEKLTSAQVGALTAQTQYFDVQGSYLGITPSASAIYTVTISAPTHPTQVGIFKNSASSSLEDAAAKVYQVQVTVSFSPGGTAAPQTIANTNLLISPYNI